MGGSESALSLTFVPQLRSVVYDERTSVLHDQLRLVEVLSGEEGEQLVCVGV